MQDATFYNRLQGLQYRQRVLDVCPEEGTCYSLDAAYRATRATQCLMKGEIAVFMKAMQDATPLYRGAHDFSYQIQSCNCT